MRHLFFLAVFFTISVTSSSLFAQSSPAFNAAEKNCRSESGEDNVKFYHCMNIAMEKLYKIEAKKVSVETEAKCINECKEASKEPAPMIFLDIDKKAKETKKDSSKKEKVVFVEVLEEEKELVQPAIPESTDPRFLAAREKLKKSTLYLKKWEEATSANHKKSSDFIKPNKKTNHVNFRLGAGYGLHFQDPVIVRTDSHDHMARGDMSHGPHLMIAMGYKTQQYSASLRAAWMLVLEETEYDGAGNFLLGGPEFLWKSGDIWWGGMIGFYGQSGSSRDGEEVAMEDGVIISPSLLLAVTENAMFSVLLEANPGACIGKVKSEFGERSFASNNSIHFCGFFSTDINIK